MRSHRRSRLTKRIESKTRKSLFLSILGIFIILFVVVKFGVPLLANFALFISNSKTSSETTKHDTTFIAPPILNPLPIATNSANIEISGIASPNQTISLYINDSLIDKNLTQKDGSFSFKNALNIGENNIKVKATVDNKDSDFSESFIVAFKSGSPNLTINAPSDGQSFSKENNRMEVKGSTDPQARVTVNDFWAITDENNNFSYTLPLQNGDNKIKVTATDQAGNKTEKEIKVTYSP